MAKTYVPNSVASCHQRKMRDREAAKDGRPQDTSMDGYYVDTVSAKLAKAFILRYEWLGTTGHTDARYAVYNAGEEIVAVALFGRLTAEAANLCGTLVEIDKSPSGKPIRRTEYAEKTIALERGACAHWAHPHTASWMLPRVLARANADHGWKIFYAYSDTEAGEIGTVYQAANWMYIGIGVGRGKRSDGSARPRWKFRHKDWEPDRWVSSKAFYVWARKRGVKEPKALVGRVNDVGELTTEKPWQRKDNVAKHKYVQFVAADKRELKELRKALRYPRLPYPKRA